jgi:uroporphyrinogen-III decarboxylase
MSDAMTGRERLLAAIRGEEVDRIPWSPFLAYWWEHQPQDVQDRGQTWFMKEIGADPLLRGFSTPFTSSDVTGLRTYETWREPIPGCEVRQDVTDEGIHSVYETPVGSLTSSARYSPDGDTFFVVEHPVKKREDYGVLRYLVEHMQILPAYGPLQEAIDELGDDGLFVALISPFGKTPFQALVEHFVGTEQLVYDLMDYPEEVEALLAAMSEKAMEAVRISVESPAEAFITWEDSSTTNVSPRQFETYIAPEMTAWGDVVRDAGKIFIHHACGHLKALLPIMAQESIDVVESISPPPTGNVEIWEAQQVLQPEGVGIIGGIEPTMFLNLSIDDLRAYVVTLLERTDPHHYVLANSDSCPPGVAVEKFRLVSEIVREWSV